MTQYPQIKPIELQNISGGTLLGTLLPKTKPNIGRIPYPEPVKPKLVIM